MGKLLSIELTDSTLRVSYQNIKKKEVSILDEFRIEFDTRIISDTSVYEIDNIAFKLNKALKRRKITARDAVFVINSSKIHGRKVVIPKQKNENDFLKLLHAKVTNENVFPISLDDYYLSYSLISQKKVTEKIKKDENDSKSKNKGKNNSYIECTVMAYVAPISLINGIQELADASKLVVKAVEYTGNSIYQYTRNFIVDDGTDDYILVHINSINSIVSSIKNHRLVQQRGIDFNYKSICSFFFENERIFGLTNFKDVISFINRTNFLDKDKSTAFKELKKLSSSDRDVVNRVQGDVLNAIVGLIDSINSFIAQCRVDDIHPTKIYYLNECNDYPDISESLEYYVKLPVENLQLYDSMKSREYLACYCSYLKPIDFMSRNKSKKALETHVRQLSAVELFIVFWVVAISVIISYISFNIERDKNEQLNKMIAEAEEARTVYNDFISSESNLKSITEFDESIKTDLSEIDLMLTKIEEVMPVDVCYIDSISISDEQISFPVKVDSKDTLVKFVQGLNTIDYFDNIDFTGAQESEGDDFKSGRIVTSNISCHLLSATEEMQENQTQQEDQTQQENQAQQNVEYNGDGTEDESVLNNEYNYDDMNNDYSNDAQGDNYSDEMMLEGM